MENISLRAYIRKIENQIDNSQIDQAIAHCKHILKTFPKHIDSYRLLGKALLEKQKYGDASDIFQRVLSSVPDDFISHIGMSMIREDENNLDAAIWHMERAFEVQPSNKAVQDELRRLYTSRDGIAPPKIRLTRGALVRMYTRGELYNQAIAEILAALSEDPNRVDLEVMLARIYFLLGKKVEATETCSKLISKLPYCLESNKILTEILLGTTRAEDQKIFRQRVIDLDPYFQFVNEKTLTTMDVNDSSIMLEFLDWDPSSIVDDQPDWAQSIGFALDNENTSSEDFSSWIDEIDSKSTKNLDSDKAMESDQSLQVKDQTEVIELDDLQDAIDEPPIPATDIDEDQSLPDWIKEAGWEVSSQEDESKEKGFKVPPNLPIEDQTSIIKNDEVAEEEEPEILPAEIPSWLKAIAPSGEFNDLSEDVEDNEDDVKNLENLFDSLEKDKPEFVKNETKILWENEFSKGEDESLEETLRGFNFSSMINDDELNLTSSESELEIKSSDNIEESLDWIKSLTIEAEKIENEDISEPISTENVPKFEKDELINKQSLDQIINELEENKIESQKQELSDDDWLNSLVRDEDKEKSENESPGENEKEEIPEWIKSVVDEESEQASLATSEEIDSLPDWLSFLNDNIESNPDDIKISIDEEQNLPTLMENSFDLVSEDKIIDDEIAEESYSELLDDEVFLELETQIEDEFVLNLESTRIDVENSEEVSEEIQSESNIQDELELPIDGNYVDEVGDNFEPSPLGIEGKELLEGEQVPSETEEDELDSALAWMEGLASKQGAEEETLISSPAERSETPPEWISEESNLLQDLSDDTISTPSWLKELEIETEEVIAQEPDQLLEKTLSLDITSSEDEKVSEFFSEMEIEKDDSSDSKNLNDQLETENESQQIEAFDLEIDEEILPTEDLIPEIVETEIYQEEKVEEEFEDSETQELIPELSFEEVINEEENEVLETTFIEEAAFEEIFKSEDQELELIDEISSSNDEIVEPVEEILERPDQESEKLLTEDEEIEDTQPIKIKDNRLADLEMANKYLDSGNPVESIALFDRLIQQSFELDQIINNIQIALDHHYPIDINLWQSLGDAYFKDNQLQNALDAYSKAEDLLS